MKNFVVSMVFLLCIGMVNANAQTWRTDAGAIVVEDSILSPNRKQIVFVATKTISEPAVVRFETMDLEGIVNRFAPISFPDGIKRGQIIPIRNGEFNQFESSAWLRFGVTINAGGFIYYTVNSIPVNQPEQYKEPMITGIGETKISSGVYQYSLAGNFDRYMDTVVVINNNVILTSKDMVFGPGSLKFTMENMFRINFPTGKFLMTICQSGQCDSMVGRHQ